MQTTPQAISISARSRCMPMPRRGLGQRIARIILPVATLIAATGPLEATGNVEDCRALAGATTSSGASVRPGE